MLKSGADSEPGHLEGEESTTVIDRYVAPVFIEPSAIKPGTMIVRIGLPKAGQTRVPSLNIGEARMVVYAVLLSAQRLEAGLPLAP